MLGIQRLIKDAENAPVEVQKGIIQIGLERHLYPFQPRQKQVDAIWRCVYIASASRLARVADLSPWPSPPWVVT